MCGKIRDSEKESDIRSVLIGHPSVDLDFITNQSRVAPLYPRFLSIVCQFVSHSGCLICFTNPVLLYDQVWPASDGILNGLKLNE